MLKNQKMLSLLQTMLVNAYSPYSEFKVSACILTEKGNFYTGCNVENASYGLTTCAEANAIGQMVAHGERQIKEIAIMADTLLACPPCGACRQRLREFASENTLIHLCNKEHILMTQTLEELLPNSFGPAHFFKTLERNKNENPTSRTSGCRDYQPTET